MSTTQECQKDKFYKIIHVTDIENLLEMDNLEEYINNASFQFN